MNKNLKTNCRLHWCLVLLGLVLGAIMWAFSHDALWGYELPFKESLWFD